MKNLKKQFIIMLSILFSITVLFTSCINDDSPTPQPQNSFTENFGLSVNRNFMGKIVDENNNPIDGVNIKIGSKTAITDANGIFVINNANVYERFAYVTAEKGGYINGSRALIPTTGTSQVKIMLLAENIVGTVPSGSDSEVNLPNGTIVKFDGAFKDANGNAYMGNVTVMMQHLASSDSNIEQIMPGMLYAQNANNEERLLETYGMINVQLRGSGGEALNLADGSTAIIEFPIDPLQTSAPSTIELWSFDEENGYWIEDGSATKQGNKYVGEVSHFSWWNFDVPIPTVNLCMTIKDANGNAIYGVIVELFRSGATFPGRSITDGNGEICGLIPANETLTMVIKDPCGNQISTSSIGPFSSDTNLGTQTIPASQSSEISGMLLDCNNNPVTDGYAILKYGAHNELTYTVTNGAFNFTTATCNSLTNFILEGVDITNFQTTGDINYTFTPPTINVGSIIACNGTPEYITYQIDNEPVVILLASLSGNVYSNSLNVSVQDSGIFMFFSGDSIIPGTYNSPDFDLVEFTDRDLAVPSNIQFVLSNVGTNVGDYIDMTFSGTYTDTSAVVRNITGTIHVKRDN